MASKRDNGARGRRRTPFALAATVLVLLVNVAYVVVLWTLGDRWWAATVLLFAPRWPLLAPLALVSVWCLARNWRLLWLNGVSLLVLLVPGMGFCVPALAAPSLTAGPGEELRILTYNLGEGVENAAVRDMLERRAPDIVFLQECREERARALFDSQWHVASVHHVCIASRYPIFATDRLPGEKPQRWSNVAVRARLDTPAGLVWAVCVHLDTVRHGLEELSVTRADGVQGAEAVREVIEERSAEAERAREWISELEGPVIVAGDFNMPVESRIYQRCFGDLRNAFSTRGWGLGHTWRSRWHGVRIDHVLHGDAVTCLAVELADSLGGDHRPMEARLRVPHSGEPSQDAVPRGASSELEDAS